LELTVPTPIEIVQGETATATVKVKNLNNSISQSVTVSVLNLISNITSSVAPPTADVAAEQTSDFIVTFTVPADTKVDDYSGSFQASSSEETVTSAFTINVLPSEATKAQISRDFENLKTEFNTFWNEVNNTKLSGTNVSTTTLDLIEQARAKIAEAESQLALGTPQGYFAAAQLIEEARNLLETAKAQLKVDRQGASGFLSFLSFLPLSKDLMMYIGIGIGVAVAGILVYLFLPPKGSSGFKLRLEKLKLISQSVKGEPEHEEDKRAPEENKNPEESRFEKLKQKFTSHREEKKYKYEE
jgi:hypothetical protein